MMGQLIRRNSTI